MPVETLILSFPDGWVWIWVGWVKENLVEGIGLRLPGLVVALEGIRALVIIGFLLLEWDYFISVGVSVTI